MRSPFETKPRIDATANGYCGTTVCDTQANNGLQAFSLLGNGWRQIGNEPDRFEL